MYLPKHLKVYSMFYKCIIFKSDLSMWNVENVNRMYGMFYNTAVKKNFTKWNVKNISFISDMFKSIRL